VPYEQSVCHKYGCASAEAGAESAWEQEAWIQGILLSVAAGRGGLCVERLVRTKMEEKRRQATAL